jgi:hypothetical protein
MTAHTTDRHIDTLPLPLSGPGIERATVLLGDCHALGDAHTIWSFGITRDPESESNAITGDLTQIRDWCARALVQSNPEQWIVASSFSALLSMVQTMQACALDLSTTGFAIDQTMAPMNEGARIFRTNNSGEPLSRREAAE